MYGESVRGINPLSQGLRQSVEATTTIDKGKRQRLTKGSARGIRAARKSRLGTVKRLNEFIPLHLLRSLTVREHFHVGCCSFLIVPSANADTSAVPSHVPEENADPNAGANEKKSNWKSTASATAKLLLRGVRESADAFGPLKAVAGGLCFILENCEVWPMFLHTFSRRLQVLQQTKANKQVIESLAPRVDALAESLCAPVPKEDFKELGRRRKLEQ